MSLDHKRFQVPVWTINVAFGVLGLSISGVVYWLLEPTDAKALGLVGGVVSGLIVFMVTYATVIWPSIELNRYRGMGIVNVLSNRHEKAYYRDLVRTARMTVLLMGASSTRFVDDFLDPDSDDKVLFDQLQRHAHLTVRLLVPSLKHLTPDARAKSTALMAKVARLNEKFPGRVELRRFDGKAHHSFVLVDDDLVAGPVFEGDKSRHAPAVHVKTSTTFAAKYREHFEEVWRDAT